MKKIRLKIVLMIAVLSVTSFIAKAQQKFGDNLGNHKASKTLNMNGNLLLNASGVAIGTIGDTTMNGSVILNLNSVNKALLVSRVTDTSAITAPLNGMIVYNAAAKAFYMRQDSSWVTFALAVKASTGIDTTGNVRGYTLTQVGGATILKLSAATLTMPGVVSDSVQTFGGNKTFAAKTTLNADTVSGGLILKNAQYGSGISSEKFVVVDSLGKVKKSSFSPASFDQQQLTIPTITLGTNSANIIVITGIANLKKNDGVVINFDGDELTANPMLAYISILNATATADGTVTVTVADMRQYDGVTALSDAGALISGKHFTFTRYRK